MRSDVGNTTVVETSTSSGANPPDLALVWLFPLPHSPG